VLSLRGRPEVRVGGFRSVAGGMLAGRWAPLELKLQAPAATETPKASASASAVAFTEPTVKTKSVPESIDSGELDSLLTGLDAPAAAASAEPATAESSPPDVPTDDAENDLDALLNSLGAEPPAVEENATEPDLDALLASLK
jgi:type VI secretion system protein ImpC